MVLRSFLNKQRQSSSGPVTYGNDALNGLNMLLLHWNATFHAFCFCFSAPSCKALVNLSGVLPRHATRGCPSWLHGGNALATIYWLPLNCSTELHIATYLAKLSIFIEGIWNGQCVALLSLTIKVARCLKCGWSYHRPNRKTKLWEIWGGYEDKCLLRRDAVQSDRSIHKS
jgi:hypothetical protein